MVGSLGLESRFRKSPRNLLDLGSDLRVLVAEKIEEAGEEVFGKTIHGKSWISRLSLFLEADWGARDFSII